MELEKRLDDEVVGVCPVVARQNILQGRGRSHSPYRSGESGCEGTPSQIPYNATSGKSPCQVDGSGSYRVNHHPILQSSSLAILLPRYRDSPFSSARVLRRLQVGHRSPAVRASRLRRSLKDAAALPAAVLVGQPSGLGDSAVIVRHGRLIRAMSPRLTASLPRSGSCRSLPGRPPLRRPCARTSGPRPRRPVCRFR